MFTILHNFHLHSSRAIIFITWFHLQSQVYWNFYLTFALEFFPLFWTWTYPNCIRICIQIEVVILVLRRVIGDPCFLLHKSYTSRPLLDNPFSVKCCLVYEFVCVFPRKWHITMTVKHIKSMATGDESQTGTTPGQSSKIHFMITLVSITKSVLWFRDSRKSSMMSWIEFFLNYQQQSWHFCQTYFAYFLG